jgi:hypothetical protein
MAAAARRQSCPPSGSSRPRCRTDRLVPSRPSEPATRGLFRWRPCPARRGASIRSFGGHCHGAERRFYHDDPAGPGAPSSTPLAPRARRRGGGGGRRMLAPHSSATSCGRGTSGTRHSGLRGVTPTRDEAPSSPIRRRPRSRPSTRTRFPAQRLLVDASATPARTRGPPEGWGRRCRGAQRASATRRLQQPSRSSGFATSVLGRSGGNPTKASQSRRHVARSTAKRTPPG